MAHSDPGSALATLKRGGGEARNRKVRKSVRVRAGKKGRGSACDDMEQNIISLN